MIFPDLKKFLGYPSFHGPVATLSFQSKMYIESAIGVHMLLHSIFKRLPLETCKLEILRSQNKRFY